MTRSYPDDQFDHLPRESNRVGAHRAPARKGRGWVPFWWALGTTLMLILIGVFALVNLTNRLDFAVPGVPTTSAVPEEIVSEGPAVEPTVDPSLSVTVLNGTADGGLAATVGYLLTQNGWVIGSTSNSDTTTVETTTVYYQDASLEGPALGVAGALPGAVIMLSDDFANSEADLTVIVGNDYVAAEG